MLCHLSCVPYLLAPIPRGPHLRISLTGAVPPDVEFDPDLVHCGAQFCQSWERGEEMEFGGECRQEATLYCLTSPTRRAWHGAEGHPYRKLVSPRTRSLHAPILQDGSPWLETNWVSIREEALCPASWAHSCRVCSGESVG